MNRQAASLVPNVKVKKVKAQPRMALSEDSTSRRRTVRAFSHCRADKAGRKSCSAPSRRHPKSEKPAKRPVFGRWQQRSGPPAKSPCNSTSIDLFHPLTGYCHVTAWCLCLFAFCVCCFLFLFLVLLLLLFLCASFLVF